MFVSLIGFYYCFMLTCVCRERFLKCFFRMTRQVHITKEYLQLEPIGLVFVFFFALILIIQFTAMLFHRFGTISHILASTELNLTCSKKSEELSQDALIDKVRFGVICKTYQVSQFIPHKLI